MQNEKGEFLYVMENVTYTPEVVIKNNRFAHVPTRGILCTTRRKVLIEGNHFQNITMSTIFISNDSNDWYESGPVRDMTIRGNIFHVSPVEDWHYRKPAIYIHPIPLGEIPSPVPIHKNITVENNTFYMQHEYVVSAENVENLTIKENKIVKVNPSSDYDGIHDVLFEFDTCKNVLLEGNTYEGDFAPSARMKQMKESDLKINNEQTVVFDAKSPLETK